MTTKTVARKAMINLLVRVEFIAGQRSLYQNALPENALLAGMQAFNKGRNSLPGIGRKLGLLPGRCNTYKGDWTRDF